MYSHPPDKLTTKCGLSSISFLLNLDDIPPKWEHRVALYCTFLINYKRLNSSTIKSYVSAIKYKVVTDGYDWQDRLVLLTALTKSCKMQNDVVQYRFPPYKFGLLELILCGIENDDKESNYTKLMFKTFPAFDVLWTT